MYAIGIENFIKSAINYQGKKMTTHQTLPLFIPQEINSINQSRKLNLITYNEFRKKAFLSTIKSFNEFSPSVANILKKYYKTPDEIDLYVGCICEQYADTKIITPTTQQVLFLSALPITEYYIKKIIDYLKDNNINWEKYVFTSMNDFIHANTNIDKNIIINFSPRS